MKKIQLNGKTLIMALSFFAFMILGTISASAQNWVSSDEALLLLKDQISTLESDYAQANNDQERLDIAFSVKYYSTVYGQIGDLGMEVSVAVDAARPQNKATKHSSGLIYFGTEAPDFKVKSQALINAATDLLSN